MLRSSDIYIYIYIYIYNMCFHASTTTLNLYTNLYYAKTKWLLFETKDIFQKCNSTIKTLLGLKTTAKDIWSILGRTKGSCRKNDPPTPLCLRHMTSSLRHHDVIQTHLEAYPCCSIIVMYEERPPTPLLYN